LVFLSILQGATPVQAATNAVISIDSTSVAPGGTTVVTVKAQEVPAPGLAGYDLKIHYDPAVVKLVALSGTSDFPAPYTNFGAPTGSAQVPGDILVVAAKLDGLGTTGDIKLFTLTFQALSTTAQVSPLTLTVTDFAGADLLDILPDTYTTSSSITITSIVTNPVTDFGKTTLESTAANFAWTPAVGATALWIQQSTDIGANWVDSVTDVMPLSSSATLAKVLNLVPGTPYLFKLQVRGGEKAGASNVVSFTMPTQVLNSDATLTSTIGTVSSGGTVNETITGVPSGTILSAFRAALTPTTGAAIQICTTDGTTVATDLADGYKVVVTAQNGTNKTTYTLHFASSTITHEYGNLNGDHLTTGAPKITSNDALLCLQFAARLVIPTDEQAICANVDGDYTTAGKPRITSTDALLILKRAARLITKFPIEP